MLFKFTHKAFNVSKNYYIIKLRYIDLIIFHEIKDHIWYKMSMYRVFQYYLMY